MKRVKTIISLVLALLMVVGVVSSAGWAADFSWDEKDPVTDGWNIMDLLLARPIGIAAGIFGSAVFIVALPFTVPTKSVEDAAQTFIVKPFSFSFARQFPDEDM